MPNIPQRDVVAVNAQTCATPAVRALANARGVLLAALPGTGAGGRIQASQVRAFPRPTNMRTTTHASAMTQPAPNEGDRLYASVWPDRAPEPPHDELYESLWPTAG